LWIVHRVVDARKLRKPHSQEWLCYCFHKKSGKIIEMKITVEIPSALRRFTDGVQTIECSSETLPDLLGEIEQRFPAISKHLRDDAGQVRRFVNIYVNEEDIRFLGGNSYKFREGDRVLVVPSIAGGAPADACG
jgi:molybdopterin synthase sulfur carrier subunit